MNPQSRTAPPKYELSSSRKKIFWSITLLSPLIVFLALESALRIFNYGGELDLFISAPSGFEEYLRCNPNIARRYFSGQSMVPTPSKRFFLKKKPSNGYRIFVLGESSAAGFPFEPGASFPVLLERALARSYPEKKIEVVSVAMSAVSSYTLLDLTGEILDQSPDAVIIYAGHNEYYGALGVGSEESIGGARWIVRSYLKLRSLRVFLLVRDAMMWAKSQMTASAGNRSDASATLMENMVAQQTIPYGSSMYEKGKEQFRENLGEIVERFSHAGVRVIVGELVSNVRDQEPFVSVRDNDGTSANELFSAAHRQEEEKEYDDARKSYYLAKDRDALRFRAPEEFNGIISSIAAKYSCEVVHLKTAFENASPNGLVGNSMMIDHLHPNREGYLLMAKMFFETLTSKMFPERPRDSAMAGDWTWSASGFTRLDSVIASLRIMHLKSGWPFKPAGTKNMFRYSYTARGIVDSLAFMTIEYFNFTPVMAHRSLAAYYESHADMGAASEEYLSAAYSAADPSLFYYAADYANRAGKYKEAIQDLSDSPGSDTSSYAQYILASIFYSSRNYDRSLHCIARLEDGKFSDESLLRAEKLKYHVLKDSGLVSDAGELLSAIRLRDPSFDETTDDKSVPVLIPGRVRPYLEKADELRKMGRYSEAVEVLREANRIKEIPYTNLMIGSILFAMKNAEALTYLEKASLEFKDDPKLEYELCALYVIKRDELKARKALEYFAHLRGKSDAGYSQLKDIFDRTFRSKD